MLYKINKKIDFYMVVLHYFYFVSHHSLSLDEDQRQVNRNIA